MMREFDRLGGPCSDGLERIFGKTEADRLRTLPSDNTEVQAFHAMFTTTLLTFIGDKMASPFSATFNGFSGTLAKIMEDPLWEKQGKLFNPVLSCNHKLDLASFSCKKYIHEAICRANKIGGTEGSKSGNESTDRIGEETRWCHKVWIWVLVVLLLLTIIIVSIICCSSRKQQPVLDLELGRKRHAPRDHPLARHRRMTLGRQQRKNRY